MSSMGCTKTKSYEETAEELLNEKYQDTFVVEEIQSVEILEGYYTVIAYQEDAPDRLFKAWVKKDGSGVDDNYVTKIICEKISDKIERNLDVLNGIYYVYTSSVIDVFDAFDPQITLEQYIESHPQMLHTIYLFYCQEEFEFENFYNGINRMLEDLPISGKICLFMLDEEQLKEVQGYLESHDQMYDDGDQIFEPYYRGVLSYEKGKIEETKEMLAQILGVE